MAPPRIYRPSVFLRLRVRLENYAGDDNVNVAASSAPPEERVRQLDAQIATINGQLSAATNSLTTGGADIATVSALSTKLRGLRAERNAVASRAGSAGTAQTTKGTGQLGAFFDPATTNLARGEGDPYSISLYAVPVELNCEVNTFRACDTLSASLQFDDAPLVSEIIRAALVDVWIGTIRPEDFATYDRWRLDVGDTRTQRIVHRFCGYVDTWDTTHTDETALVQIQARSLEAVLLDAKINAKASAYLPRTDEKISVYVDRILEQLPAASSGGGDQLRSVWYGAKPEEEPTLKRELLLRTLETAKARSAAAGATANTEEQTAAPIESGSVDPAQGSDTSGSSLVMPPKAAGQEMSVWDLITQACELTGCVPVYDPSFPPFIDSKGRPQLTANWILLRPPQTITAATLDSYKLSGGPIDGFSRKFVLPGGKEVDSEIRFMVWGHNIKSMKTSRKLGRIRAPAIEVLCYNPDAAPDKRVMQYRFPPKTEINSLNAKGSGAISEVKTIVVRGIRDMKALQQIAVSTYHSIARQELSVAIETDDLASYIDPRTGEEHNASPDILKLTPGSPCRVTVAREVKDTSQGELVMSPLSEVFEMRQDELRRHLRTQQGRYKLLRSPDDKEADKIVDKITTALQAAKFHDLFYCRTVRHTYSVTDGWSAQIELVNYLQARANSNDAAAKEIEAERAPVSKYRSTASKSKAKAKAANVSTNEFFSRYVDGRKR